MLCVVDSLLSVVFKYTPDFQRSGNGQNRGLLYLHAVSEGIGVTNVVII